MYDWIGSGNVSLFVDKYYGNELPISMTVSSTATSCLHIVPEVVPPNGYTSLTVFVSTKDQLREDILSLVQQGYQFHLGNVHVTCSIHQLRLRDARQTLIASVLSSRPTPFEIEKVISDTGIALNLQIDKNPLIFGNRQVGDDIHRKLIALLLPEDEPALAAKYASLNRYFNASKHAKNPQNIQDEAALAGAHGVEIAIDFFETARRIFIWYYRKYANGVPNWMELEPIDFYRYGSAFVFQIGKLWT